MGTSMLLYREVVIVLEVKNVDKCGLHACGLSINEKIGL